MSVCMYGRGGVHFHTPPTHTRHSHTTHRTYTHNACAYTQQQTENTNTNTHNQAGQPRGVSRQLPSREQGQSAPFDPPAPTTTAHECRVYIHTRSGGRGHRIKGKCTYVI